MPNHTRQRGLLLLTLCLVPLFLVGWEPVGLAADSGDWAIHELSPLAYGRSLALDAANSPQVAYAAWHSVHYAYRDDEGWHDEIINSNNWYDFAGAALVLDASATPHIAFTLWYPGDAQPDPTPPGTPRGSLLWAERGADGWQVSEVQSTDGVRFSLGAIALASNGVRHVVFTTLDDASASSLWYGRKGGTNAWDLMLIAQDGLGTWGFGAADLVLDGENRPVISYCGHDLGGPFVAVVTPDPAPPHNVALRTGWGVLLRVEGDQADRTALALAPDGALHLLYAAAVRQDEALITTLKHYWQDSDSWAHEVVRQAAFDGDIALDQAGEPHAVWLEGDLDQGYGRLTYARRVDNFWQGEYVSANASGSHLGLGDFADPHIAYDVGAVLRYARRSEQWPTPTVPITPQPWLWLPLVFR